MPVYVRDPQLGPGAKEAAERLFREAPESPDVVIVVFVKNVTPSEGRTGVGTASRRDLSDAVMAFVLRQAMRALGGGRW